MCGPLSLSPSLRTNSVSLGCSNWVFHFLLSLRCGYLADTRAQPRSSSRREKERERERFWRESVHKVRICPTRHVHQQGGIEKLAGNPDGLSRTNPQLRPSLSSPPFLSSLSSSSTPFIYPLTSEIIIANRPFFACFCFYTIRSCHERVILILT